LVRRERRQGVVLAAEAHAALAAPHPANHDHRLFERIQRRFRLTHRTTETADRIPERPRPEPTLDASPAQPVERGRRFGEDHRMPHRQVGNILEEAHPLGLPKDEDRQRDRVEVGRLVGMILDPDQVVAEGIDALGDIEGTLGLAAARIQEIAELEVMSVIAMVVLRTL